jgi:hypothetical protein
MPAFAGLGQMRNEISGGELSQVSLYAPGSRHKPVTAVQHGDDPVIRNVLPGQQVDQRLRLNDDREHVAQHAVANHGHTDGHPLLAAQSRHEIPEGGLAGRDDGIEARALQDFREGRAERTEEVQELLARRKSQVDGTPVGLTLEHTLGVRIEDAETVGTVQLSEGGEGFEGGDELSRLVSTAVLSARTRSTALRRMVWCSCWRKMARATAEDTTIGMRATQARMMRRDRSFMGTSETGLVSPLKRRDLPLSGFMKWMSARGTVTCSLLPREAAETDGGEDDTAVEGGQCSRERFRPS